MKIIKFMNVKKIVLSVIFAGFSSAIFAQENVILSAADRQLVSNLYEHYDKEGDNFMTGLRYQDDYLSRCKRVLQISQQEVKAQLDGLSYKNVVLSGQGAKKMGLIVGGLLGAYVSHQLLTQSLWDAPVDLGIAIGQGILLKKRGFSGSAEDVERGRDESKEALHSSYAGHSGSRYKIGSDMWSDTKSLAFTGLEMADKKELQRLGIPGMINAIDTKLNLQKLATGALAVGAAIGGFGLIQDIRAMSNKKQQLTKKYEDGKKMLALLVRA